MFVLREPAESDWIVIGALANAAVEHIPGAPQQGDWLDNRRSFAGVRRHVVVEHERHIVGYGAVECSEDKGARLFLVLRWLDPNSTMIAELLFQRLQGDARQMPISQLWAQEYAEDHLFCRFLSTHGFKVAREFENAGMAIRVFSFEIRADGNAG